MERQKVNTSHFSQKTRYSCDFCHYETDRLYNFQRHLENKKHLVSKQFDQFVEQHEHVNTQYTDSESDDDDRVNCSRTGESINSIDGSQDSSDMEIIDSLSNSEEETDTFQPEISRCNTDHNDWFPFNNKVHYLLSILVNSRTHKVSDEIAAYFLFVLKEVGVVDVPSLKQLKDFNTTGLNVENMIVKNEDKDGNLFWTVKPSALIGLAVANPNTACTLKRYPEKNPTKDAGHAGSRKWKEEIDFHWGKKKNGDCIYLGEYVKHGHQIGKVINFISMISEGQSCLTIVMQLVKINPQELDCYNDDRQNSTGICLITGNMVEYPIDECELMDLAIIENISFMKKINGDYINCTQQDRDLMLEVSPFKISNLPVVTVPINIFIDDTSANKSRRWDALHCIQTQLAGIPLKDKQRNRNVMVLGTSDKVAILDIAKPICDDILSLKSSGIRGFDAMTKENIMITSDVNCIIADYNCVSLVCNHLGPSANKFCPKCMADSSDPLSFEWEKRTPNKTQRTIEHIKIARNKVEIRKENGVKEHTNCFWEIINCHKDTPTGLLHFMYLGLVKHLVQLCLTKLSEQQKEKLELHLNSLNLTSFPYPVNGKFIKYVDSRQGKDFKTYVQVAFFNMEYVRLPMKYLQAISALAMMSKHIHTTEGTETVDKDIKNYIAIIKEKIPELSSKKKTHLCMHLIDDIKEHGCLLEYSEDAFEKNHGLIRSEIFIQNQLAKSRDTAAQFSRNAILEHIISGGYFLDNNNWIQASQQVQSFGRVNIVEKFMGKGNETKGKFTLSKLEKKDNLQKLSDLQILQAFVNCGLSISSYNEQCTVTQFFGNALTKSGERATLGGYVLYLEEEEEKIGRIKQLANIKSGKLCIEIAVIVTSRPVIYRCQNIEAVMFSAEEIIVPLKNLIQNVHLIHDCIGGFCPIKETKQIVKVEQEMIEKTIKHLQHNVNHDVYLINKFRLTHLKDKYIV
ncbi:unnamed protein product [Mytilus edulis]|uniref:C2H2-type domain-containing protein n=3 Tax=Mytilus edulis TaxID=6550 RepID=A0A8S3SGW8_MYTED|nr:unnamed protein product [Mytilus edulis]